MKTKVLFICVHNSARSQMAEAWLNHICGEFFVAQSAGLEPGTLNPHWSFADPSQVTGTAEEKLARVREIRDAIRAKVENWCAEVTAPSSQA